MLYLYYYTCGAVRSIELFSRWLLEARTEQREQQEERIESAIRELSREFIVQDAGAVQGCTIVTLGEVREGEASSRGETLPEGGCRIATTAQPLPPAPREDLSAALTH